MRDDFDLPRIAYQMIIGNKGLVIKRTKRSAYCDNIPELIVGQHPNDRLGCKSDILAGYVFDALDIGNFGIWNIQIKMV